jgi:hypothetical protein
MSEQLGGSMRSKKSGTLCHSFGGKGWFSQIGVLGQPVPELSACGGDDRRAV